MEREREARGRRVLGQTIHREEKRVVGILTKMVYALTNFLESLLESVHATGSQ